MDTVVIFRELRMMTDQTADQFAERIKEVTREFDQFTGDEESEEAHLRALTVSFYPSFYYDLQEE